MFERIVHGFAASPVSSTTAADVSSHDVSIPKILIISGTRLRMISRRAALVHMASVGAALVAQRSRALAKASQPSTPVNFKVPAGACDCHTHIFCDAARFAFWPGRVYTPEPASVAEMRALHRALHM